MKLSQLKPEKIRLEIPIYSGEEIIDTIKIYNPTHEQYIEIDNCIRNSQVNDGLRHRLLGELTNIDIDCEVDDDFYKYYSDLFKRVMMEIDFIIEDIALDIVVETNRNLSISDEKIDAMNNIYEVTEKINENIKQEISNIEENKLKDKEKAELQRTMEEAKIKLEKLK
jgi:DNA-directed RNA polymerase beta' subunit